MPTTSMMISQCTGQRLVMMFRVCQHRTICFDVQFRDDALQADAAATGTECQLHRVRRIPVEMLPDLRNHTARVLVISALTLDACTQT